MTTETKERYIAPRVNIFENTEVLTVEAELPGVSKDQAEIEVKEGELVLTGKRNGATEGGDLRLRERPNASFYRAFVLGKSIDTSKIEASMSDGVLTITLPKLESVKPRAISIN